MSEDDFFTKVTFSRPVSAEISVSGDCHPGIYIACTYDNEWYIGNIVERSEEHQDVLVNFMRRSELNLSWPRKKDECWVPFQNILVVVQPEINLEDIIRIA